MTDNPRRHDLEARVIEIPLNYGITDGDKLVGHVRVYEKGGSFSGEVLVNAREVLAEASAIIRSFFTAAYDGKNIDIDTLHGGVLLPGIPYKVKFAGRMSNKPIVRRMGQQYE